MIPMNGTHTDTHTHTHTHIYIYIYIYIWRTLLKKMHKKHIYIYFFDVLYEKRQKTWSWVFYNSFLVHNINIANKDEGSLIIVRNSWCHDTRRCIFGFLWSLSKMSVWPRHRLWNVLCDQWIIWIRTFTICSWRRLWTYCALVLACSKISLATKKILSKKKINSKFLFVILTEICPLENLHH